MILLITELPSRSELSKVLCILLIGCKRGGELPGILLVWQRVDCVRLVDEVLIVVAQPIGKLRDRRGRRVFRLATTTHDLAPLCLVEFDCRA